MCLDDVLTSVSTPWVHYATEHVVRKCRRHILFSVQKCETMPTPGICLMGVLRDRGGVSWNFWVGGCPNTPPPPWGWDNSGSLGVMMHGKAGCCTTNNNCCKASTNLGDVQGCYCNNY